MKHSVVWSLTFSAAIATLMLAILLFRTEPVETWVLVVYPSVGALLAHVASRTSPTVEEIAWIETGTIAAACIVVLAALVNLLLVEIFLREVAFGEYLNGSFFQQFLFFALPTISALLWWSLERRLTRMRREGRRKVQVLESGRQEAAATAETTQSGRSRSTHSKASESRDEAA